MMNTATLNTDTTKFQKVFNKIMGNISSYLQPPSVFTQCIRIGRQNRKRKTLHSQQLIDIDCNNDNFFNSDDDDDFNDDDEKIIFYKPKKKKNILMPHHTPLNDH